ncbi:MAG: alpha/beta hydrolase [Oscillospiraceae bacterium]|nr:alpha/beta hydrolase [Oscillospiraceae bacterium]
MRKSAILKVVKRILKILCASILIFSLLVTTAVFIRSPGVIEPYVDENNNVLTESISEKVFVEINGVEQGMIITGKSTKNPVILFVHGGPGMPEYFLSDKFPTGLDEHFTVCWWDQRGGGLSYSSDLEADNMTVAQLVDDTIAVTNYLREKFGQDKIYLMGHSWGTFIGIQAAAEAPQLYAAYIAIAQITNSYESEQIAYSYMLEQYVSMGNRSMVKKFLSYAGEVPGTFANDYLTSSLRDEAMHKLGIGTTRNMTSVISGVFFPVWWCRAYTVTEKINIWRGKAVLNTTGLCGEMYSTDITELIPSLDIPIYFISGIYDYTVSYKLANDYYGQIEAPIKAFYTFYDSAHSPIFEEPERFVQILVEDVRNEQTALSDFGQ